MGICCQEQKDHDDLMMYDYANKVLNKTPEETERQFYEMIKRIDIADPFMKVLLYLIS